MFAQVEDGSPCCDWVGEEGAGHFVKMVHNGIEYGDMQLICEAYLTKIPLPPSPPLFISIVCFLFCFVFVFCLFHVVRGTSHFQVPLFNYVFVCFVFF